MNWWEAAPVVEPQKPGATAPQANWWEDAPVVQPPTPTAPVKPDPSYQGSILPFSIGPDGKAQFDTDAGIIGSIKRAIMLPRDAYDGKVDLSNEPRHWTEPDPTMGRVLEAAATINPVNPAVRAGDAAIPGPIRAVTREKVAPPSAEALRQASDAGYEQARNMGVDYSSGAVKDMAARLQMGLEKDGVFSELAPKTFALVKKLQEPPTDSVAPLSGLEAARRSFGHAAKDFANPTEQMAAQRVRQGLDEFLEGGDPANVVAGSASEAARTLKDARGNYAAAARSDKLHGIEEAAELRAAAANSGQNLDNSIRQRIANLLIKPKEAAGFSEAELGQLETVARGSRTGNAARWVGNVLGGGGGLGTAVPLMTGGATGYATGSPGLMAAGIATPVIGYGAKKLANALTERGFRQADEMTRMRSPLYEKMLEEAPMTAIAPERRAAVVKALMLAQGIDLDQ